MNVSPCKGCEYRHLRCHATCDKYKAYATERQKLSEHRLKESEIFEYMDDKFKKIRKKVNQR